MQRAHTQTGTQMNSEQAKLITTPDKDEQYRLLLRVLCARAYVVVIITS